jgi:TolB-like protein/Tfp pilus assembly protein PilF
VWAALVMLGLTATAVWLTSGATAPVPITSLVVLPFETLGPDGSEEYFSDGLTEELINRLSSVSGLRVVARTTAFHFKGRTDDVRLIARRLNVEALLTGTVRRQGDRLRITAHLSRGSDGVQLWSQTFDHRADDLFAVQEEIARRLTTRLGRTGDALPTTRGTRSQEAHRLLLLGNFHRAKFRERDLEKALRYYQEAVQRDPTFAQAHAEMAYAYAALANAGLRRPSDVYPVAFEAAHRALAIDESLATAHTGLGIYHLAYAWDWAAAERALRRAIELNPCEAQAHHWYAHYFMAMERYPESLQASQRALDCDPLALDLNHHLAEHYCATRDFDRCIAIEQKTLELDPQYFLALWKLRVAHLAQRRFPQAIEAWRQAGFSAEADRLDRATRRAGAKGYWQEHLAMLLETPEADRTRLAPFLTLAYAQLGDTAKAIDWLEQSYAARSMWMINVRHDWELDPLRDEPRFQEIVRRMRFP